MSEVFDVELDANTELEAEKLRAEIRKLDIESERLGLSLENDRMIWSRKKAGGDLNRVYTFYDTVTSNTCYDARSTLAEWSRQDPGCPITLVLTSPGGSIMDGLGLFDFLTHLRKQGHHLTIIALGMAASMGGVLLQAGDHRIVGANAFLLIHEASSMARGKTTDMAEDLAFVNRLQGKCLDILSERSTLSRAVISRKWKKVDWWLDAAEAVADGFADEIQ